MSKIKWGKLLVGAVAIGAAVAGGIAYFSKRKEDEGSLKDELDELDDDLDAEDFDTDEPLRFRTTNREYVSIPKEGVVASADLDKDVTTSGMMEESKDSNEDAEPSNKDMKELKEEIETEKETVKGQ